MSAPGRHIEPFPVLSSRRADWATEVGARDD
jgi:hypothetical protein